MGDDEEDWLVRTELVPRTKSFAPAPPSTPPERPSRRPSSANVIPDPAASEIVLRREPLGTVWLAATDEEAAAVFQRKRIQVRNPFTKEIFPFDDLVVDRDALARLPCCRGESLGTLARPEASSALLRHLGCDAPHAKDCNDELLVYQLPASSSVLLAGADVGVLAREWTASLASLETPVDVPRETVRELAGLATRAIERKGKLWTIVESFVD